MLLHVLHLQTAGQQARLAIGAPRVSLPASLDHALPADAFHHAHVRDVRAILTRVASDEVETDATPTAFRIVVDVDALKSTDPGVVRTALVAPDALGGRPTPVHHTRALRTRSFGGRTNSLALRGVGILAWSILSVRTGRSVGNPGNGSGLTLSAGGRTRCRIRNNGVRVFIARETMGLVRLIVVRARTAVAATGRPIYVIVSPNSARRAIRARKTCIGIIGAGDAWLGLGLVSPRAFGAGGTGGARRRRPR